MSESTVSLYLEDTDKWLNFQLICKPEQSGKTFVMISHIIHDLSYPIEGKDIVNFILCDNNLLLTKQTSSRVENDLQKYVHDNIVYVELSSHARTDYHNIDSVFRALVFDEIKNVICCTNGQRMNDIYSLITQINVGKFTNGKFHFNIWLDEADKFVKFIDNTLRPLVDTFSNVNVKLITATPKTLFTKYKYMNVLPIENTTSEYYHGWEDNVIRIIEKDCSCLEFIEHILSIVAPNEIKPRTKWLIPGLTIKKSHEAIKMICVNKGMAVLCVNSDGLVLTLPQSFESIYYKRDDDFNTKIKEIYRTQNLHRFAIVITGYICIGRGITINSDEFMIDYAILSHYSNKDEASQMAGRMKGNMKGFKNYNPKKPPIIFTTEIFNKIAIEWESKSRSLANLAFEKEQNGYPTVINKIEFKTCNTDFEYICHDTLFNSFEQAKKFLITKEREMKGKVSKYPKSSVIHECDGYFVTSKLLSPGQNVNDLTKEDRITIEKSKTIAISRCISSTDKGSRYLILPVYENENTPPDNVKFQVRYIKFN
jgi:hypothetical protein